MYIIVFVSCLLCYFGVFICLFFFSSRRRHTRCALVTGVQTCALPISGVVDLELHPTARARGGLDAWGEELDAHLGSVLVDRHDAGAPRRDEKIGRASCRERVCQYV